MTPYEEESIAELLKEEPIIVWPQENLSKEIIKEILADPSSRLYNIFLAFLYSLPPYFQGNALAIYQEYQKSISAVADWLIDLYERGDSSYDLIPSRARQIINAARSNAQRRIEEGSIENLSSLVNEEIRRLIELEEGASLFHLSNANRR